MYSSRVPSGDLPSLRSHAKHSKAFPPCTHYTATLHRAVSLVGTGQVPAGHHLLLCLPGTVLMSPPTYGKREHQSQLVALPEALASSGFST